MPIPIPVRASGFMLGDPQAKVSLEAFVDIQCPHSKRAWPTLLEVLDHYQSAPVSLTVHLITLSNHRQAWDMSLALFAVADGHAQKFFDFASFLYARQDQFYNSVFGDKTHHDLRDLLADCAEEFCQYNREDFLRRIGENDVYVSGRTPIRYAATRSVWATPTLFVNNADDVPVNHESSLSDWIALIDPLLEGTYQSR